ncbi:MAG: helix-turn-helix transcriptional regulator, partial [Alphaproteobacteria bacterium]|nr:helix-turn-helix transcriptional regulator [Alphaproteobacteria bacterium]
MDEDLITERLGALAHPSRFAIVRLLVRAGPAGLPAGKLGETLGIAANAMTFHLQKLSRVGLLGTRRAGQFIIYSAVFPELRELADQLVGACC